MTLAARKRERVLIGHALPRIAPPVPMKHDLKGFRLAAESLGITLMPAQETAAKYLTATNADGGNLYREIAILMARQNGKTTLMKPVIKRALEAGKRVLHLAHTRELPRQMFAEIAPTLPEDLFLRRRGKGGKMQTVWPRGGAGQEEILLANGGSYRIAAAGQGGGRGQTTDLVIIDELREMKDTSVISAVLPTLSFSKDPQIIYLSNAGDDTSVVLNAIRDRADEDPSLAYLEWSAAPERSVDDREGWAEANPSIGIYPHVILNRERDYLSHKLGGTLEIFETENLCRWVTSMKPRLVDEGVWLGRRAEVMPDPLRPFMAIEMDGTGTRASAAIAWRQPDMTNSIGLRIIADVTGDPIDTDKLGADLRQMALRMGVPQVAYGAWTTAELARYFKNARAIENKEFCSASENFVRRLNEGSLQWDDAGVVTEDLAFTARKMVSAGVFEAVKAKEDRPITSVLAAIRAVWLASGPKPLPPKVM